MTNPPNQDYENLKAQQMEVYADMLQAFESSATLASDISQMLSLADFSDHDFVIKLNQAIENHAVGTAALARAFSAYAESHNIKC